jgi:DNA-binding ferritin-like protein
MDLIISPLLSFVTCLKLFHWRTHSYVMHKASNKLLDKLDPLIDEFVETLQGVRGERVANLRDYIQCKDISDTEIVLFTKTFITWLNETLPTLLNPGVENNLLTIRDDMLNGLDRFLYLISFQK